MQGEAAKQRETDGKEPLIQQRLQKKVTKRVQFLERVASSKRQASLAVQGGLKKKRRKGRKQVADKRLGDLSQLAASLQEAAQLVSSAPPLPDSRQPLVCAASMRRQKGSMKLLCIIRLPFYANHRQLHGL